MRQALEYPTPPAAGRPEKRFRDAASGRAPAGPGQRASRAMRTERRAQRSTWWTSAVPRPWTARRPVVDVVGARSVAGTDTPPAPRRYAHGLRCAAAPRFAPLHHARAGACAPCVQAPSANAVPVHAPPPLRLPPSAPVLRTPPRGGACPAALCLPRGHAPAAATAARRPRGAATPAAMPQLGAARRLGRRAPRPRH